MDNARQPIAYNYLPLLSMLFVTAFLAAIVLSHRMFVLCGIEFAGGVFAIPFTFFLGDVITEVYGSNRCNQIIYITLICQVAFSLMCQFVLKLPPPDDWHDQHAYDVALGILPHYCFATIIACLLSFWINNFVLVRIRRLTSGKHLWLRTIGATAAGEAVFTIVVICIGYHGVLSGLKQMMIILSVYIYKVLYEILSTPFTYLMVRFLKNREVINIFEKYKNIDPYTLEIQSKDIV